VSPSGAARAATATPAIDEPTRAWLLHPASPTTRRLAIARLGLDAADEPQPTAGEPWIRTLLGEAIPEGDTTALQRRRPAGCGHRGAAHRVAVA
jgi:hypothetical protein